MTARSLVKSLPQLVGALWLAGCATGEITPDNLKLGDNESLFVLGVAPKNIRVLIYPGEISNGNFTQSFTRSAVVGGTAPDGYLAGKAKAGDIIGITTVVVLKDADDHFGTDLSPCDGAKTVVFRVPAGRVIYLTDIEFVMAGPGVSLRYRQDLPGAKAYLETNFPRFAAALEPHEYELLPTMQECKYP